MPEPAPVWAGKARGRLSRGAAVALLSPRIGGPVTDDRRVAVIGLGYVGLPLAISFVEAGLEVEGIDAWAPRVEELNRGESPIDDVSDERLRAALRSGLRVVGSDDGRPGEAD